MISRVVSGLLTAGLLLGTASANADERQSLEQLRATTMNLIQMLVKEGVLSKAGADALIKQAEAAKEAEPVSSASAGNAEDVPAAQGANSVVHVQYVPEFVKSQMRDEIKQELMTELNYKAGERLGVPDWIDRISFDGDLRLRYEQDKFPPGNTLPAILASSAVRNVSMPNTINEHDYFRERARLGAKILFNDWLTGGLQLTTGNVTNPLSPNQTLNTKDSKFSFALDRAYLKAQPYSWMTVSGGRFANPFFSTDLVWDPDLAFDGIAASFTPKLTSATTLFSTVGAFPIEDIQKSDTNLAKSKWLFGGQAGIEWKSANASTVKFGVAYYDFENVQGEPNVQNGIDNSYNATALSFRQKGNDTFDIHYNGGNMNGVIGQTCGGANGATAGCGLASKFQELNLTGQIDLATFNPAHVILTADYVNNFGFDQQEILARTGALYQKETEGYQLKLAVGNPTVYNRHEWQVFGAYKYLQADAVLDALTDSDFHLGGTDAKGWILGGSYGLDKNAWLSARWFSTDQITGLPLSIDTLMLDFNAKF